MKVMYKTVAYFWFVIQILSLIPVGFIVNLGLALMYGMQESLEITKEIYNEIKMDLMKALQMSYNTDLDN